MRRARGRGRVASGVVRATLVFALAAVCAACSGSSDHPGGTPAAPADATEAAATVPSGFVGHEGRWLTDSAGRVLLPHGVNMVAKDPPYTPAAAGFSDDDAAWLAANGFRFVRLGVLATGLMPQPGKIDQAYVTSIADTVDLLSRHGIYTLLDFHQDGWGPSIGSDGFPAWMTLTKGATDTHASFPLYYVQNPAIQQAFQSFWDNAAGPDGVALQDDYAMMFGALASRFADNAMVLGYDLFNEPWPGNNWGSCLGDAAGCPDLDRSELGPAYGHATAAIRAAGDKHLVFGEPFVLFNFGVSTTAMPLPGNDAASGMSFHLYTTDPAKDPNVIANAAAWSADSGGALLNTEWGATTDTSALARQTKELDEALVPWAFWSYCCEVVKSLTAPPAGDNLVASTLDALVEPYPLAVAGTPRQLSYDRASKTLTFTWDTARTGGGSFPAGAVTSVVVPASVYASGYHVTASGGDVVSACGASEVAVRAKSGASSVTVTVAPGKC